MLVIKRLKLNLTQLKCNKSHTWGFGVSQFNVDFKSDFLYQSRKQLNIQPAILIRGSLNRLLNLIEDMKSHKRGFNFKHFNFILEDTLLLKHKFAEDQTFNAFGDFHLVSHFLD